MPWNCLYTLKNALNAGFEWPKFKAFSSSIRQTRVITWVHGSVNREISRKVRQKWKAANEKWTNKSERKPCTTRFSFAQKKMKK